MCTTRTTTHRVRRLAVAAAVAVGSLVSLAGPAGAGWDGQPQIAPSLRGDATVGYIELTNELVLHLPVAGTPLSTSITWSGRYHLIAYTEIWTAVPIVAGRGCVNVDAHNVTCRTPRAPSIVVIP